MNKSFSHMDHQQEQEIVLLRDDREQVKDTTRPPFRWICSLEVEFPEPVLYPLGTLEQPSKNWQNLEPTRKGCGSGLLISPQHVLTASHVIAGLKVVQNKRTGQKRFELVKAQKVRIIPGRNEARKPNSRPFGVYASKRILVSPRFRAAMEVPVQQLTKAQVRKALAADYGVIEISAQTPKSPSSPILPGQVTGWWGELPPYHFRPVDGNFRKQLQQTKVYISGYPGEKARLPCSVPWQSFDKVIEAFPKFGGQVADLLLYQADTSAGMSGSPVWMKGKNGQFYLVAVHSSFLDYKTSTHDKVNAGALLTGEVIRQLRIWKIGYLEVLFFNKPGLKKL